MSLLVEKIIREAYENPKIFYHGSTDRNLLGKNGIHVGTFQAAKEALDARIGVPAHGDWNGTSEYGKTLLKGKMNLKGGQATGYNCGNDVPDENYYPTQRKQKATYSDRTEVPFNCKPEIFKVQIIGPMTNGESMPHADNVANGLMKRSLNSGKAKTGYYYKNHAEDVGSISAVVPNGSFLRVLN